jgi:hypothetical protein
MLLAFLVDQTPVAVLCPLQRSVGESGQQEAVVGAPAGVVL